MEAQHARIEFQLEEPPKEETELEEERKKHQLRAERFGLQFRDPGRRKEYRLEARKERLAGEGFITGIDMFSEEEKAKRAARAAKFGVSRPEPVDAYAPDPEEVKRKERGAKFGTGYNPEGALMDMDLFETRADAPPDAARRPDAIYLYGVDVMSTADVKGYFGDYAPRFVEWINDSSCCVLFGDAASAARAIVASGHPLPADVEAPDAGGQGGLDPTSIDSLPYLWHKGRDFVKGGTPISLMYRMATEADRKDTAAPRRSRYLWKTAGGGSGSKRRRRPDEGGYGGRDGDGGEGMEGYEEYGGGGGGDDGDDHDMQRRRGERGGEQLRRQRRKRAKGGDIDMHEAGEEEGGGGGKGAGAGAGASGGSGKEDEPKEQEDPAKAAEAAAATTAERFGVPDLRQLLAAKAAGGGGGGEAGGGKAGRIDELAPEAFEEVVPPADEEAA
ncbi:splicing RNP complex component protein [Raphidocelis subcapitata]|uniref:Splicing RNP complex component protein n=1 Tax=Raphidocelis subcapitata TaxID=307507 RepID=A0A2V0NYN2_9CHLO|nr:splicing RNP complex component protein [Raphidocelis subcapitata]|eukprot:GBF90683.1 splicing RNP complex component protein [Raphidocelis subcapitata]